MDGPQAVAGVYTFQPPPACRGCIECVGDSRFMREQLNHAGARAGYVPVLTRIAVDLGGWMSTV